MYCFYIVEDKLQNYFCPQTQPMTSNCLTINSRLYLKFLTCTTPLVIAWLYKRTNQRQKNVVSKSPNSNCKSKASLSKCFWAFAEKIHLLLVICIATSNDEGTCIWVVVPSNGFALTMGTLDVRHHSTHQRRTISQTVSGEGRSETNIRFGTT